MHTTTKILASAMMMASLAACQRSEPNKPVVAAEPVASEMPAPPSLIPAKAGITTLDIVQLAGAVPTGAPCALDTIAKQPATSNSITVTTGDSMLVQGWVATPAMQAPEVFALVLTGDNAYAFRGQPGVSRPDVARVLKQKGLEKSGFNVHAKLDGVVPGEYSISLIQEVDGSAIQCMTKGKFMVAGK